MINSNEVRRGNLVNFIFSGKKPKAFSKPLVIDVINAKKIEVIDNLGFNVVMSAKALEGVPLTRAILEKLSFKMENGFLAIDLNHARMKLCFYAGASDKLSLMQMQGETYDSAKPFYIHFGSNNTPYLHQLQNLFFALTGEELDTKNLLK